MTPPEIHDRGRGPEIKGTRITVYDVLAHQNMGWSANRIALFFRLDIEQIECALAYIDQHRAEVEADYAAIKARHARGNPPELQARLDATHERFLKWKADLEAQWKAANGRVAG